MSDAIYKKPGETFSASLRNAPAGMVGTLGVSILHKVSGTVVMARTTAGIIELPAGSGNYEIELACPAAGEYIIFWDNGVISPTTTASEDLISTINPPAVEPVYDIESDLGIVRLLISDVGGKDGTKFIFTDAEIEAIMAIREGVRATAATLLRVIAGNESQVSKRITFLELSTDGPAVSKELRELAKGLEAEEDDDAVFEIAQMNVDMFSRRQLILKRFCVGETV